MSDPKFKIGDRVKWVWGRIGVIAEAHEDNRYSFKTPLGWASKVPGDQLVLDVPEPKQFATDNQVALASEIIQQVFKIGDHVMLKGTLDTDVIEGAPYGPYYALASRFGWWHESLLSLDVPAEPKQFATDNQVALASEVIQQLYKIAALEKELREANAKIKRFKSLVGEM